MRCGAVRCGAAVHGCVRGRVESATGTPRDVCSNAWADKTHAAWDLWRAASFAVGLVRLDLEHGTLSLLHGGNTLRPAGDDALPDGELEELPSVPG